MRPYLFGLATSVALAVGMPARAQEDQQGAVPKLDHVFVIVLENHNSFTSFGSNGIIGNPQAPNITTLWNKYNVATNYNGVWHPSLPNYVAMITGNWVGTDVIATGHVYAPGSTVGISDDDSASISTDYPHPRIRRSTVGLSSCHRLPASWLAFIRSGGHTCKTSLRQARPSPIGPETTIRRSSMP